MLHFTRCHAKLVLLKFFQEFDHNHQWKSEPVTVKPGFIKRSWLILGFNPNQNLLVQTVQRFVSFKFQAIFAGAPFNFHR